MFDRYVQGTKPSWKRRAVLTVSLALHAIAVVVLVVYSFIHVEEVTPPPLSLTFFSAPPPPPPPPPPAAHHKEVKRRPKVVPTQPTTVPKLVQPKEEEPPEDDSDDNGEEGGVEGGVAGGVAGGVVGGVVGGTGTAPVGKPKNVPPQVLEQQKIAGEIPHLPDIVKIQRKGTGDAVFMAKICIDRGGNVSQVSVIQGIPGADQQILATLRSWRYKPQPLPICSMSRFVFSID